MTNKQTIIAHLRAALAIVEGVDGDDNLDNFMEDEAFDHLDRELSAVQDELSAYGKDFFGPSAGAYRVGCIHRD